jgi:hypothetical protein
MVNERGAAGEMRTGRGIQSTGRKLVPLSLQPQIPYGLTWYRTRVAASNRLSYGTAPSYFSWLRPYIQFHLFL